MAAHFLLICISLIFSEAENFLMLSTNTFKLPWLKFSEENTHLNSQVQFEAECSVFSITHFLSNNRAEAPGRCCAHSGRLICIGVRTLFASHYIAVNGHVRISLVRNSSRKMYLKTIIKWVKCFDEKEFKDFSELPLIYELGMNVLLVELPSHKNWRPQRILFRKEWRERSPYASNQ